jgi:hypothetical protein
MASPLVVLTELDGPARQLGRAPFDLVMFLAIREFPSATFYCEISDPNNPYYKAHFVCGGGFETDPFEESFIGRLDYETFRGTHKAFSYAMTFLYGQSSGSVKRELTDVGITLTQRFIAPSRKPIFHSLKVSEEFAEVRGVPHQMVFQHLRSSFTATAIDGRRAVFTTGTTVDMSAMRDSFVGIGTELDPPGLIATRAAS